MSKFLSFLTGDNKNRKSFVGASFVGLFAIVGTILVLSSRAATPFVSLNAASGSLSPGASLQTDSSGNQYVRFGNSGVTLSNPPSGQQQTALLANKQYGLKLNEWNSSQPITMTSDGNADFTITHSGLNTPVGGAPSGYYELWKGSSWGANTANGGAPFPLQVSTVTKGRVTTSATCSTAGVAKADSWDNAYDIWFNQSATAGQTSTNGGNQGGTHLEMMVWLNQPVNGADPVGKVVASNVVIGGNTFNIWYNGNGSNPNTVSYVLASGSNSINFDMLPMIQDAESRGYLQSSWYLLDVEFGFEIWTGGNGLGCSNFTVNAS